MEEFFNSAARLNRASADFLKADVATALTFSGIALAADDAGKRDRNRRAARKAYDTVLRLKERVALSDGDVKIMARNLQRLKSELTKLGETF